LLFVAVLVLYNLNGREIPSYDSQPSKFAARELIQRGTITLNHVVGTTPQLLDRASFVAAADGNYRSAYSPTPVLLAAAVLAPFYKLGILDIRAPLAALLIAKLAASTLTAGAVALLFLTARRWTSHTRAVWIAIAAGAGTGYWSTVSQTLWQHESAALGLALAVWGLARPAAISNWREATAVGLGLGIAGTSRAQLSIAISVLVLGLFVRVRPRLAVLAAAIIGIFAATLLFTNVRWFGHPLGAIPMLEALHPTVHATEGSFRVGLEGPLGLLFSPNRGLLIFSPVVLAGFAGLPFALRAGTRSPIWWCACAAVAQYLFYGAYSVWWGGHTFGPRYALDLLPLLAPVAAAWIDSIHATPMKKSVAAVAFAWSATVAATGAFCYPHERWNTDPNDVDRNHERLWDWRDMQIVRCWSRGPNPTNFRLIDWHAIN
jgi:hypothetical protein